MAQFARMITHTMQALDVPNGHALAASGFRRFEAHQDQFMHLNEAFDEFVVDGNDALTVEGLAGAMNRLGLSATDEDVHFVFAQLDEDKSGQVDVRNSEQSSAITPSGWALTTPPARGRPCGSLPSLQRASCER